VPRAPTPCQALTIGQLARRWSISPERVRQLALGGDLPGAFRIPSAGRYGETIKIPLATVVRLETEEWAVAPEKRKAGLKSRRRGSDSGPALRHFPGLVNDPPDGGSPEDAAG
jgi:hypothetical protein